MLLCNADAIVRYKNCSRTFLIGFIFKYTLDHRCIKKTPYRRKNVHLSWKLLCISNYPAQWRKHFVPPIPWPADYHYRKLKHDYSLVPRKGLKTTHPPIRSAIEKGHKVVEPFTPGLPTKRSPHKNLFLSTLFLFLFLAPANRGCIIASRAGVSLLNKGENTWSGARERKEW